MKVKKTPHGCCTQDPSSPYLPSAWKIWFFCQRNQYSGTKRKPLSRFALHPSACGLGTGEEGRAGTNTGKRCAASREFPLNFPGAPCLTRIMRYKAKAVAKEKISSDKSFPFPCHFAAVYCHGVVLILEDSSPFWSSLPSSGDRWCHEGGCLKHWGSGSLSLTLPKSQL